MNIKIPLLLLVILYSCNSSTETKTDTPSVTAPATKDSVVVAKINIAETDLADKKDVVCGMPAFQYLNDTAVYNGKIYGFCSKDCKNDFLKDPASYIVKK